MHPSNMTIHELLDEASRSDDPLLLELARRFDVEVEKEADAREEANAEEDTNSHPASTARHLCWYAEWEKLKPGHYVVKGFQRDFHPDNHHIEVLKSSNGQWVYRIEAGTLGEFTEEGFVTGSLRQAQDTALDKAIDVIINGHMLNEH